MHLKTVQATSFKATFEVLKDVLNDVNIYFDSDGMKMVTLDTARTALVDLELYSENFEEYSCPEPLTVGLNVSNIFKLLKIINTNDTLTIDITDGDFLNILIENPTKKTKTKFQLKLLDIDEDRIEVPDVPVTITTIMPSIDFQRICRDMNNLASEINIVRKKNIFVISCEGDFANQETVIMCNDNVDAVCSGTYSLKYLKIFTKATGMCSTVEIMQEEENKFLILQYNVANLGELKFYVATKVQDN